MSEFKVSCPMCDQHIACDSSYYGLQINCPTCGNLIQLPSPPSPLPTPSAGAPASNRAAPGRLSIAPTDPKPVAPREPQPDLRPPRKFMRNKPRGNSWLTTFLFAWFLGGFGVDRFYNGRVGLGIGKLLTAGGCGLWSLIDILLLLFKNYEDAQGNYLRPARRSDMAVALSLLGVSLVASAITISSAVRDVEAAVGQFQDRDARIRCVQNLKQIGLAFRMWSNDHDDHFPFNVPVKKGGSLEYCQRTPDGFDANSFRHFQALSQTGGSIQPALLICPADKSKTPAENWAGLDPSHLTYLLRSGPGVTERKPREVLGRCPIHHTIMYCDGSVESPTSGNVHQDYLPTGNLSD